MIRIGATASTSLVVDDASTASALGSGDVPVLGTPKVVALVEAAAVAAIAGMLEDGQTSVGTNVTLDHLAPTRVGSSVLATATVTSVDRRSIRFDVDVTEDGRTVATGTHVRAVVDRSRFLGSS
ncbi:MAG TPA: hotdog domain-containing protein [Acidimicrobiia bacterium]|nr:hotdog domain-containing protein [Acidimicrobiia bacterium]